MKYTAPKADLIAFEVITSILNGSNELDDVAPFSLRNRDAEAQDSVGNGTWE